MNVTQNGAVYTVDGYDDQCGAGPAGAPGRTRHAEPRRDDRLRDERRHRAWRASACTIEARITLATLSGPWSDSAGNSGTFAFGASTGGSPRPAPTTGGGGGATIPATFSLLQDGGFLARGTWGVREHPGVRQWHTHDVVSQERRPSAPANVNSPGLSGKTRNIGSHSTAFGPEQRGHRSLQRCARGRDTGRDRHLPAPRSGPTRQANGNYSTAFGADTQANGGVRHGVGGATASPPATTARRSVTARRPTGRTARPPASSRSPPIPAPRIGYRVHGAGGFASIAGGFQSVKPTAMECGRAGPECQRPADPAAWCLDCSRGAQASAPGTFLFADRSTQCRFRRQLAPTSLWCGPPAASTSTPTPRLELGACISRPGGSQWLGNVGREPQAQLPRARWRGRAGQRSPGCPCREWSYNAQDAAIRHMGPTAQDFHAAFGLGEDPLRIGTMDADGVALAAVRALGPGRRTRATNDRLTQENDDLRARSGAPRGTARQALRDTPCRVDSCY